jgi:hypothetical protein
MILLNYHYLGSVSKFSRKKLASTQIALKPPVFVIHFDFSKDLLITSNVFLDVSLA